MKQQLFWMLVSFSAVLVPSAISQAQSPSEDGIHGTGEVVLERSPELLQLHVNVLAKGQDLPDALKKLKTRRAEVEKQLETLGAVKESVKFGSVELNLAEDARQLQMERAMRQRMAQQRGQKPKPGTDASVKPERVMVSLTAEWPLPTGEASETLLAAEKLQKAIRAAELGALKDVEEPTPEEAELAEEMDGLAPGYDEGNGPSPGQPRFLFVARVSDADRDKALADAFLAAKQEAVALAKAAELELGPLRSLRKDNGSDAIDEYNYRSRYQSAMQELMSSRARSGEVFGMTPGPVKLRVVVHATFSAN